MNPLTDPAIEDARRAGFDLNLIEMNLSLPPDGTLALPTCSIATRTSRLQRNLLTQRP